MNRDSANFRSSFPNPESVGFRSAVWKFGVPSKNDPVLPIHPTLIAALEKAALETKGEMVTLLPEDEAGEEKKISFAEWNEDAKRLAMALIERGVTPGDRVLMVLPTSYEFLVSFFAIQYAGAIPVPSYPPALLEKAEVALSRLARIGSDAGTVLCLTDARFFPILGGLATAVSSLREILVIDRLYDRTTPIEEGKLVRPKPDDTAFLQYTSGSTGYPKGVRLTQHAVCCNAHAMGQGLRINRQDSGVSWLPLYHDMGLIGAMLFPIYFQFKYTLMSPISFLMRPSRWLWAIHNQKATMTVAPNFGYALCVKRISERDREGLDLSSLRVALNGAEQINYRQVVDFQKTYGPLGFKPEAMLPVYGLAENCLGVTFASPGTPVKFQTVDRVALAQGKIVEGKGSRSTALVCVGKPLPGHDVVVVDAEGVPVKDGEVGHVVVRGPSLMGGYWKNPEATAKVVRDGWLWTGDLGYQTDDGLYVAGRAKDIIIIRGQNYYAEDVERVMERIPGVRAGGSVAFAVHDDEAGKDLAVAVCETRAATEDEKKLIVEAIGREVADRVGLTVDEVVLVPPGTLPKTSSGKRQRGLTRQLYLEGDLVKKKASKVRLAMVFARSGAGYLTLLRRKLFTRREPE